MSVLNRNIVYFVTPGSLNTFSVIAAVKERLKFGDIKQVVVPFTTGTTAQKFSQELENDVEIIPVAEDEALSACKRIVYPDQGLLGRLVRARLEEVSETTEKKLRREAFDITFLPFCGETWNAVRETLYAFGQGMKVAIEISVAAVEIEKVKPYTKIIATGGTGEGVDTAIVTRTSPQNDAFSKKSKKRLSIQEIIAMPIEKW